MFFTKKKYWLEPNKICIARGNAVACNLMFETKRDHKNFLNMWDKYLGEMTEVMNYHLSPTDWTILFKTKSKEEITKAYTKRRKKSRKAKRNSTLIDVRKMLSEHIRIFLSQYVRQFNRDNGRKGGLVMERFRKYILKSNADYQKIFSILSNQTRLHVQNRLRYRANEKHYDIKNEICPGSEYVVGKGLYDGDSGVVGVLGCMVLVRPDS